MSIETAERQDTAPVAPEQPMLEVKDLVVRYGRGRKAAAAPAAVDGVSFTIRPGETVGLVGESGSGKSTIGKAILGLQKSAGGTISYQGKDITHAGAAERRALGGELRAVFQDPNSSLNPRQSIGASLAEPLRIRGVTAAVAREKAEAMLERVGLPREAVDRYPSQFSGGQRQRIAVARALICEPKLVVCDEAGQCPGPLHPGPGAQPPGRPPRRAWPELPVHRPRHLGGPVPRAARCGPLPRPGDGKRAGGSRHGVAQAPVHPGPRGCFARAAARGTGRAEDAARIPWRPHGRCSGGGRREAVPSASGARSPPNSAPPSVRPFGGWAPPTSPATTPDPAQPSVRSASNKLSPTSGSFPA